MLHGKLWDIVQVDIVSQFLWFEFLILIVDAVMGLPLFQTVEAEFGERTFLGRGIEPL
jgi:energy-converting hydrogenase Eha subunit B